MYEPKAVYSSNTGESTYEVQKCIAQKKVKSASDRSKGGLLMKLEWPKEGIFDDGKQSNTLTGAAHPGCCKQ